MSKTAADLLARYVELHNERAQGADEAPDEVLIKDLQVKIEGISLSQLRQTAINKAFRNNELILWKIDTAGDEAFAIYAWRDNPRLGGEIRIHRSGDQISKMTVRPGHPKFFSSVSTAPAPGSSYPSVNSADDK